MWNKNRCKCGFTLIELLVVVLIIGILASVALPQYQKAVWKSRLAGGIIKIRALERAEQAYFTENGVYTMDLEVLPIDVGAFHTVEHWHQVKVSKPADEPFGLEWNGYNEELKTYNMFCYAKKNNTLFNQLCAALGPYDHSNGSNNYYRMDKVFD